MAPIKTNNPYASYFDFFSRSGTDAVTPAPTPAGLTATGGNSTNTYISNGQSYKAHIFTSSGAFNVTGLSSGILDGDKVEYVVVAGGGGSGSYGGGGAGGYRSSVTGESSGGGNSAEPAITVTAGPTSYPVVVGAGGPGATPSGTQGGPSTFGSITSLGGGYGSTYNAVGGNGGSGGSAGDHPRGGTAGSATNYPGPTAQGFPGGQGYSDQATYTWGGGGGGAGATGNVGGGGGSNGASGTENTGGGGGSQSANGGKGIVVVRYKTS